MDLTRIARRTTWTLFAAQSLGSAALIAIATVSTIVAAELTGDSTWAGLPSAALQLAAAFSAFGWGFLMDWIGRRGTACPWACSSAPAGHCWPAGRSLPVPSPYSSLGLVLIGIARAALQLSRFTAAEVNLPEARGRAISYVVLGGTVGAVAGPLLVGPTGVWASGLGYTDLFGPFARQLRAAARRRPGHLCRAAARPPRGGPGGQPAVSRTISWTGGLTRSLGAILRQPAVIVAMTAMVVSQMVMVMLMVITSLHMRVHDHLLSDISLVVSSHTLGMYAFSIFSGRLTDRWGRAPVILTGAGTLVARLPAGAPLPGCPPAVCLTLPVRIRVEFLFCGRLVAAGRPSLPG